MEVVEAAKSGDSASVERLISENPEAAREKDDGVSVLLLALYHGHRDIAKAVAAKKGELDIFEACALGDSARLNELAGSNPEMINSYYADGFTPLTLAAAFGSVDCVRILLDYDADIAQFSKNPNITVAPLHSAAFGRNCEIVRLLLEKGADANLAQPGGFTALHAAAQNGDVEMIRLLLQHGADKSLKTGEDQTARDLAAAANHPDIAELL